VEVSEASASGWPARLKVPEYGELKPA